MTVQLAQIHKGMDVYGSDGGRVGTVIGIDLPTDGDAAGGRTEYGTIDEPGLGRGNELDVTPLGATSSKGRGRDTAASIVQQRGDPHMLPKSEERTRAGAAGADVMRGYGPDTRRAPATDAIAPARAPEAAPATDTGRDTERTEGSLLIRYQGLLGMDTTMLRVPLDAVREVTPDGERLVLAYPREECHQRFGGYHDTQGSAGADADARTER